MPRELGMPGHIEAETCQRRRLGSKEDTRTGSWSQGYAGTIQAASVTHARQKIRQLRAGWGLGSRRRA